MDNYSTGAIPAKRSLEIIDMPIKRGRIDMRDARMLRRAHERGESVLALSRRFDIARVAIVDRINAAGGSVRNRSEGMRLRMQQATPEERKHLAASAHAARRGQTDSPNTLVKRAQKKSRLIGHGEIALAGALREAGIRHEPQRAVGKYNLDIAVGNNIAVEVVTQGNFKPALPRFSQRIEYLREQGWCVIAITFRHDCVDAMIGNLNQIVAFIQRASRSPAMRRKNWVIRCRAERFARIRNDLGQITTVAVPVRLFCTTDELHFG